MGYYVRIVQSTAKIMKQHLDDAYRVMCALNDHNHLKRGGAWSGGKQTEYWFSWMDANYPEKCKNAEEVFNEIGFETSYDSDGNLCLDYYDSKTGQEELFLKAVSNYAIGVIKWVGEDGEVWETSFNSNVYDAVDFRDLNVRAIEN